MGLGKSPLGDGLQDLWENQVLVDQVLWEAEDEIFRAAQCQRVRKLMGLALADVKVLGAYLSSLP